MLEGTSDTGTHSRTVKIKSNVRDKEGARAVQAAVGTMDSGLPKAITFDDMDGSTLLDKQSTNYMCNQQKETRQGTHNNGGVDYKIGRGRTPGVTSSAQAQNKTT